MKPILNKEMVLEFVRDAKNKTVNVEEGRNTSHDYAIGVGRLEVLNELLDLVLATI